MWEPAPSRKYCSCAHSPARELNTFPPCRASLPSLHARASRAAKLAAHARPPRDHSQKRFSKISRADAKCVDFACTHVDVHKYACARLSTR